MSPTLPGYTPLDGNDCDCLGVYHDQPCWGQVEQHWDRCGDESYSYYRCAGHAGDHYQPAPKGTA